MIWFLIGIFVLAMITGLVSLIVGETFIFAGVSFGVALIALIVVFYSRALMDTDDAETLTDSTHPSPAEDQTEWRHSPTRNTPAAADNPEVPAELKSA